MKRYVFTFNHGSNVVAHLVWVLVFWSEGAVSLVIPFITPVKAHAKHLWCSFPLVDKLACET